ncbi:hypothetical protein QQF64_034553 [Cirrhinus molitorella]|uniref:Uncharacterized protein n=1 Tax=Cirrhinus molitorella TaxID=172907 RepID=A0ABR3L105_9TELE
MSISSEGTKSRTFKVIVKESPLKSVEDKDEIKALLATKGNTETLHTEIKLQQHDLILWRFGAEGSLIAKGDIEDNHTSYYDSDDGRFGDRAQIDIKTGSLIISDIGPEHAGEFRLKIISDRRILFKRFTVIVSGSSLSPGAVAGICVVGLLLVAAAAGVFCCCRHRNLTELKKHISNISKQLQELPKISEQLNKLSETYEKFKKIPENYPSEAYDKETGLKEMSEKLKKMSDNCDKELAKISKQLKQLYEENIPEQLRKLSETLLEKHKQLHCVSRLEMEEDKHEGYIIGVDTLTRQTHGTDEIFRERQNRKNLVHFTHESTEETGFIKGDGEDE